MSIPVDTGHKLNVHKTFNLRPVSTGMFFFPINKMQVFIIKDFQIITDAITLNTYFNY